MGINGLWKIVAPAGQQDSFKGLAARYGYRDGSRGLRMGIDASIWIAAALASTRIGSVHTQTENAALKYMFYRLSKLLEVPATFIFVFDGPARPARKRGKQVCDKSVWLTRYLKEMLPLFGFHHHQAPGEAEAELAQLNREDYIDAIISDDSDTLVFGGLNVLRLLSISDPDNLIVYHADVIEHSDDVHLSRGALAFIALCAGGDYSPGIKGCGPTIVYALAKAGYGDTLFAAVEGLEGLAFFNFLRSWRDDLRQALRFNAAGSLPSSHPSVASEVGDDFPDLAILQLYCRPVTSLTLLTPPPVHMWQWLPQQPNLSQLAQFSIKYFGWDDATVLKRFRERIWHGVSLTMFTFPLAIYSDSTGQISTPRLSTQIVEVISHVPSHGHIMDAAKVKLTTNNFVASMGPRWQPLSLNARPLTVEIPNHIFERLTGPQPCLPIEETTTESVDLADSEMDEEEVASLASKEVIEISDDEDKAELDREIIDLTM